MTILWFSTPYQFILALSLLLSNKKESYCFVLHDTVFSETQLDVIKDMVNRIDNLEEVIVLPVKKRWCARYHIIFTYKSLKNLTMKYDIKRIINFTIRYSLVMPYIDFLLRHNVSCEICVGEDGMDTYMAGDSFKLRAVTKLLMRILGYYKYFNNFSVVYSVRPDLINKTVKKTRKIPVDIMESSDWRNVVDDVFSRRIIKGYNIILLQTPFQIYSFEGSKEMGECQETIFSYVTKKYFNVALKVHPKNKIDCLYECAYIPHDVMFELSLSNDINTSTLISVNSTAAITPYILYGYTPKLIFLYKMCGIDNDELSRLDNFLKRFSLVYKASGGEIYLPATMGELQNALKEYEK